MEQSVQVVLTPTESKRILSKAILSLDEVKRALDKGILIIHPSSTTIFMLEELGFDLPEKGLWVCGHISPRGLCMVRKMIDARDEIPDYTPEKYPFDFIIQNGKLLPFEESSLGPVLETMGSEDIYVKSVNAIDPENKMGVLLAARTTGGSIGLVVKKQNEKKFKMVIPVGLEKRIPVSLNKAIKAALETKKAQGIPCSIWRLRGKIVTEIEAFRQLCNVEATPISAGGICGAEGSYVWVLKGEEKNVEHAYTLCRQVHGTKLPYTLEVYECKECLSKLCNFAGKGNWEVS